MKDYNGSDEARYGQVAILGGSAEARLLAQHLGDRARLWLPAPDRVTGQGTSHQETFFDWATGASALVIAPHPCDVDSLQIGARAVATAKVPSVTLMRPAWRPARRDHWIHMRTSQEAAKRIPSGARVLVTLGRPALKDLRWMRGAHLLVRQLTAHGDTFPMKHGRFLHGVAPFTVTQEITLMRRFRIDFVLTRNAGGPGGWPKIAAARALGVPVYMVARPRVSAGPVVDSVDAALNWLEARVWLDD